MNNKQALYTWHLATALFSCSLLEASESSINKSIIVHLGSALTKLSERVSAKAPTCLACLDNLLIRVGKTSLKATGTVLRNPFASIAIFVTVCAAIPCLRRSILPRLHSAISSGLSKCYKAYEAHYPDNLLVRAINFFSLSKEEEVNRLQEKLRADTKALTEIANRSEEETTKLRIKQIETSQQLEATIQLGTEVRQQGQQLQTIDGLVQAMVINSGTIPIIQTKITQLEQNLTVLQQRFTLMDKSIEEILHTVTAQQARSTGRSWLIW